MNALRNFGVTLALGLVWAVGTALLTGMGMSHGSARGVALAVALLTGPVWGALLGSTPRVTTAADGKEA